MTSLLYSFPPFPATPGHAFPSSYQSLNVLGGPEYPLVSLSDLVPATAEQEMMTLRDFPAIMWSRQLAECVIS